MPARVRSKSVGARSRGIPRDMLKVYQVREEMDRQTEEKVEDMLRLRMAARVNQKCTALEFRVQNLARESRSQGIRINTMADSACGVHKELKTLLTRDPRILPKEAIDEAKKRRSGFWGFLGF